MYVEITLLLAAHSPAPQKIRRSIVQAIQVLDWSHTFILPKHKQKTARFEVAQQGKQVNILAAASWTCLDVPTNKLACLQLHAV
jgi:hypothetical protein